VIETENEMKINGKEYVLKSAIKTTTLAKPMKGKEYCIIRTYSAGVFAGWIDTNAFNEKDNQNSTIYDSRRIHWWEGSASISQMALEGFKKLSSCRIAMVVPKEYLKRVIEVIPCTNIAKEQIEGANIWKNN